MQGKRKLLLICKSTLFNSSTTKNSLLMHVGKQQNLVYWELKRLHSVSAKFISLKEQTRIRVLGFGWRDLHTTWSYKGTVNLPE